MLESQNEKLREYFLELDNIIMSNPKESLVPKVIPNNKGFFNKLFKSTRIKEEKSYENIDIEGYISIANFLQMLHDFIYYIYNESKKIIEKYQKIKSTTKNYFPTFYNTTMFSGDKYSKFIIGYFDFRENERYEKKEYNLSFDDLVIEFSYFPELKNGNLKEYEIIKEDIFKLIPYLKIYLELFNVLDNNKILVSNNTYLKINFNNINDVYRNEFPLVKLQISNVAMIEYSRVDNYNEKYLSYADNLEVLELIKKDEKKLFYSCYLSDSLEVVQMLKSITMEEKND